jgi:hypothetical protein
MLTEFVALTLSRQELLELQEALAMRALVEDDLRREDGLEPMDRRPLLQKVDQLANATPRQIKALDDRLEEELWHNAWYAYTDEWAWFRARRDVLCELGALAQSTTEDTIEDLTHRRYHDKFETYVEEIDMNPSTGAERKMERNPRR